MAPDIRSRGDRCADAEPSAGSQPHSTMPHTIPAYRSACSPSATAKAARPTAGATKSSAAAFTQSNLAPYDPKPQSSAAEPKPSIPAARLRSRLSSSGQRVLRVRARHLPVGGRLLRSMVHRMPEGHVHAL